MQLVFPANDGTRERPLFLLNRLLSSQLAEIPIPRTMTGVNQRQVWLGQKDRARDSSMTENRHQPTTIHLKTLVTDRYKITVYYNRPYGEIFDLQEDPGELRNLWDDPDSQALKLQLLQELLWAEMGNEPLPMPRVAAA